MVIVMSAEISNNLLLQCFYFRRFDKIIVMSAEMAANNLLLQCFCFRRFDKMANNLLLQCFYFRRFDKIIITSAEMAANLLLQCFRFRRFDKKSILPVDRNHRVLHFGIAPGPTFALLLFMPIEFANDKKKSADIAGYGNND